MPSFLDVVSLTATGKLSFKFDLASNYGPFNRPTVAHI